MKIHREGRRKIVSPLLLLIVASSMIFVTCKWGSDNSRIIIILWSVIAVLSFLLSAFYLFFFRVPARPVIDDGDMVFAPADGTVVAVEEVTENEYFRDKRIQVSIFMSIWNVHVNWFPVGGTVDYFRHHDGDFLVAWHPKSSEKNERTTVVVNTGKEKVLFRQIAGFVARRIVSYAHEGLAVSQNAECGIIKFGSRVDLFLPPDSEIKVKLGDKTKGTQTIIAELKRG